MTRTQGFTLVELMVVVLIIGILFGFAMPSYERSVLRAHRADAQGILLDISSREERFLAQNNSYTLLISPANGLNLGTTTSSEGYYNLSVAAGGTGSIATSYLVTATATGGQTSDTDCTTITYSSAGVKSGTTGDCW